MPIRRQNVEQSSQYCVPRSRVSQMGHSYTVTLRRERRGGNGGVVSVVWCRRRHAATRQASEHQRRGRPADAGSGPLHSPHVGVTETLRSGIGEPGPVGGHEAARRRSPGRRSA